MLIVADHNPTRHIRFAYVNWAVMLACVVLFFAQVPAWEYAYTPGRFLYTFGGNIALADRLSVYASLVTYAFFHGNVIHLAGNMLTIWVFGNNVEDSMGHVRYALFFVLCAVAGAVAEITSPTPGMPIVGASGAAAGIMGAYLLLHPRAQILVLAAFRIPVLVPAALVVGLAIVMNIASAAWGGESDGVMIAFRAHLGGFAAGMALIPLFRFKNVPLFQPASSYPPNAFRGLGRFAIRIGKDRPSGWLFWLKATGFFLLVTLGSEVIVGMLGI